MQNNTVILKLSFMRRLLFLFMAAISLYILCTFGSDEWLSFGAYTSSQFGLLSPSAWSVLLRLFLGLFACIFLILAFVPLTTVITPQYFQIPMATPVPWEMVEQIKLEKVSNIKLLHFYLKKGCFVRMRVLNIFPRRTQHCAMVLSNYPANKQKEALEAVAKYAPAPQLLQK